MRKSFSLVVLAAATAVLLTACGSSGDSKAKSTPKASSSASAAAFSCDVPEGSASKAVTATGARGAEPTVKVPAKLTATKAERTVVTAGTGDKLDNGSAGFASFALYNGTTGKKLDAEGYDGAAFSFTAGSGAAVPAFDQLFDCQTAGSRVVLATPAQQAFGASADLSQLGLSAKDTVVFVGDLDYVAPQLPATAKADGAKQAPKPGFPTVTVASDGKPTVKIGSATKSSTTKIEDLKKGTGATVKSGDFVSVQYQGVEFGSGTVFDQSWGRGVATFQTSGVVPGFAKALVGQKVGSQVVAVIPPAEGYGANPPQGQSTITANSTLVFVVDILKTSSAQ